MIHFELPPNRVESDDNGMRLFIKGKMVFDIKQDGIVYNPNGLPVQTGTVFNFDTANAKLASYFRALIKQHWGIEVK